MQNNVETLIIGAGPAGLTAGYLLAKAGRSVCVIEQDPTYVGGISRTVEHRGFLFDIGGHRFFSKSKAVVDLWQELLPDDFLKRPRLSRIFYNRRYYAYPLKAIEAFLKLGPVNSVACVVSYLWARARPIAEPTTFHQWVRNQFGERLFSIFFKTYTEKVWGMSCDEISADWAAQRIKGLSLGGAIMNALLRPLRQLRGSKGPIAKTLIEEFDYPRRGPGMMWDAAAAKMQAFGGILVMGRKLGQLTRETGSGAWLATIGDPEGRETVVRARHVISSAPISELMGAIRPLPLSLFQARALRYRDFLTVALMVKGHDAIPDNWIYIHDPSVKVGRIQNFRSWSPEMLPDAESNCLGLEYFCFEGDGLWSAPDADLVELAKREIAQIGLVKPDQVFDACVVRQPKAYPVYDGEYADHVATIRRDIAANYPGLHLVGRNGMHKYNNQDHAMMTAMLTVENILAGRTIYDVWQVNEDAAYGEEGVSGAQEALASERLVPQRRAA